MQEAELKGDSLLRSMIAVYVKTRVRVPKLLDAYFCRNLGRFMVHGRIFSGVDSNHVAGARDSALRSRMRRHVIFSRSRASTRHTVFYRFFRCKREPVRMIAHVYFFFLGGGGGKSSTG